MTASTTLAQARRPSTRGVLGSPALRLVGRRLLAAIPVLWGVTLLTFIVVEALPGSAAQQLLGPNATPDQVAQLEEQLGTNRPMIERYVDWLGGVVTGDLGSSLSDQRSVTSVIGSALGVSTELVLLALFVSLALTVPVALLAARRPGGVMDRVSMAVSMVGLSVANYVLALILVLVFAVLLGWLPAIGYVPLSEGLWANLEPMILPSAAIGLPLFCFYARFLRGDLVDQMQQEEYVTTARAKGIGSWQVLLRHAFRNSSFGLITVVGLNLGALIGGTVIIEQIFSAPGVGGYLVTAITNKDLPVIQGVVVMFVLAFAIINIAVDIMYGWLNPKVQVA